MTPAAAAARSVFQADTGRTRARRPGLLAPFAVLALLALLAWSLAFSGSPPYAAAEPPVVILSSLRIRPYETLAESMRQVLRGREVRIFYLDETPGAAAQLPSLAPSAIVTVGQEALRQSLSRRNGTPLVYTMVLSPHDILPKDSAGVTGIAMVPSPKQQLRILSEGLGLKKVTLLYDPAETELLVGHFRQCTSADVEVRAVALASYSELVEKLPRELEETEAVLLVPDPTVLSEQGIKFLISSCYSAGRPVIGFSPMYLGMGAAVTLSVPPADMARQAASMAIARQQEPGDLLGRVYYMKSCLIQLNTQAISKLRLTIDQKALKSLGTVQWSGG